VLVLLLRRPRPYHRNSMLGFRFVTMKSISPRFTLGSLLLLIVIVAMGISWWLDHSRLERELNNAQTRLEARELLAKDRNRFGAGFGGYGSANQTAPPNPYPTPGEFIAALRNTHDFDQFQDGMVIFAATAVADEALPELIALFKDPYPEVRGRAIYTVGTMGRHEEIAVPAIIPMLDDKNDEVRWNATHALGYSYGSKARSALPKLKKIMESEMSPTAAYTAGMIFKIDPSIDVEPRLREFLSRGDEATRMRAVDSLRFIAYERNFAKATEDALLEAFRDSDVSLKRIIAQLLEQLEKGPQPNRAAGP
jgi:HEAT repeat protein